MKLKSNSFSFSDFEKPVILNMPANITQNADSGLATTNVSWVEPCATDNSEFQNLTSSHSPGTAFSIGVTPVEYTVVDPSGNTMTNIFTIHVKGECDRIR